MKISKARFCGIRVSAPVWMIFAKLFSVSTNNFHKDNRDSRYLRRIYGVLICFLLIVSFLFSGDENIVRAEELPKVFLNEQSDRCVPIDSFSKFWTGDICSGYLAPQPARDVENGNFEVGDLSGWTGKGETSVIEPGTDATTNNHLEQVAEGKFSAKIGDEFPWMGSEPQQSSLEQVIQLPQSLPSDYVLEFVYAVVANDPPDHPESDKPRFRMLVNDLTSNKTLLDTEYLYTSQSSKDWYLGTGASNQIWNQPYYMLANDRWVFRPWKPVRIPLAGLNGHQLNIQFEVRDCNYGAHAIYGLLDGVRIGTPANMQLPDLQGDPQQAIYIEPPFWAPLLFWFEQWGLIWLCCLLPILLLLGLLWLFLNRPRSRPRISGGFGGGYQQKVKISKKNSGGGASPK